MPAKKTDRKNKMANKFPMGIWANIFGRVIKIKGGPACGSIPKAKTAGITAKAETKAANVSNNAVSAEAWGISCSFGR